MELSAEKFTIAALLLGMLLLMGIQTMNFHRQMDKLEDTVRRLQRQGPPTAVAAGGRLRALQVADEEARNDTFAAIASEWSTTDYGVLRFDDTIISTKEYLEGIDLFDLLTIDLHDLYKLEGLVVSFGNGSRFEAMQKLAQVFRDYDAPMIEIYFQSGDRIVVGKEGAAFFDKSDLRTPQALFEGPEMPDGTTGPELIDILNGTYQAMQKELFDLFTIDVDLDEVEGNGANRRNLQYLGARSYNLANGRPGSVFDTGLARLAKTIDLTQGARLEARGNSGRCVEAADYCFRKNVPYRYDRPEPTNAGPEVNYVAEGNTR